MSEELLTFSESQQQAIIAHALQYPEIWNILDEYKVNESWLVTNALKDCYKQIQEFIKSYERPPKSVDEIADFVADELIKESVKRTISKCVENKKKYPWDVLEKKLTKWAKSRYIYVTGKEFAVKFNDGKHEDAYQLFEKAAVELQRIDALAGVELDGFVSAAKRIDDEALQRASDSTRCTPYAINYLQDATGGMLPTDVVLWGATSGAGKTEAARIQAAFSARTLQEPVHYFALEAEDKEIERRTIYSILSRMYKEEHTAIPLGMISYMNFRKNRLVNEFAPYEKRGIDEFKQKYSTLNTYYRKRGDFGLKQLDRELFKLKGNSRLIIIDHIHFFDLETDNEVREMSELIKKIRQMSIILETPMIIIAHITEKGVKHNELVPKKDDFYGASNLFKTATTAIMMAPVHGLVSSDSRTLGKPTFLRIVKGRLENSLQYYPGIVFFNSFTNEYTPFYSVGQFDKTCKKWTSLKGEMPIWINMENNVTDVSNIE